MTTENTVPVRDEDNINEAERNRDDTTLGPVYDTENKQAGELEAVQRAYDQSTPSYELNLDSGDFAGYENKGEDQKKEAPDSGQ